LDGNINVFNRGEPAIFNIINLQRLEKTKKVYNLAPFWYIKR